MRSLISRVASLFRVGRPGAASPVEPPEGEGVVVQCPLHSVGATISAEFGEAGEFRRLKRCSLLGAVEEGGNVACGVVCQLGERGGQAAEEQGLAV